jgi:uncharacterized protein (DUF2164 family)
MKRYTFKDLVKKKTIIKEAEVNEFNDTDLEPLTSFELQKDLDRDIWDDKDVIKEDIREKLLKIAEDFWEELAIKLEYEDIILTGSLCNYNYSKYSDFDLHILLDFSKAIDPELLKQYTDQVKKNWNTEHNIIIDNFDVELYVQPKDEDNTAKGGMYSLLNNEWIKKPTREEYNPDTATIKRKAEDVMAMIDDLEKEFSTSDNYEEMLSDANKIWEKIKDLRKSGLESGGELSTENLVFKFLRRNEYTGKILKLKTQIYDKVHGDH